MTTRSRVFNRLTKAKVEKAARDGGKPLHDGGGLYFVPKPLAVSEGDAQPGGWWKFKYNRPAAYGGSETSLSFGLYPHIDLGRAREDRDAALKDLARDVDPSAKKKAERTAQADTFEAVAREWIAAGCPGGRSKAGVAEGTIGQLEHRLKTYVFPRIGKRSIAELALAAPEVLKVLRRIESKGTFETAQRVRAVVSRVFRYAIATGRAERDPAADLKGAIASARRKNFAAVTDAKRLGVLLRAVDEYTGQPATRAALQVLALVFVRPGELRAALWGEFDLRAKDPQWVIPAERMKMRREHVVPLAPQAVAILEDLRPLTDRGAASLVFPGLRPGRPLSENTLNMALRTIGYDGKSHVGHGFRSTASTLLHELGYASETIETQLAHSRPGVGGVYNRSHLLAPRRKLMVEWASYLEGLKADRDAKVAAIRS
jgi:integrase